MTFEADLAIGTGLAFFIAARSVALAIDTDLIAGALRLVDITWGGRALAIFGITTAIIGADYSCAGIGMAFTIAADAILFTGIGLTTIGAARTIDTAFSIGAIDTSTGIIDAFTLQAAHTLGAGDGTDIDAFSTLTELIFFAFEVGTRVIFTKAIYAQFTFVTGRTSGDLAYAVDAQLDTRTIFIYAAAFGAALSHLAGQTFGAGDEQTGIIFAAI